MAKILKHFIPKAFERIPVYTTCAGVTAEQNKINFLKFSQEHIVHLKPMNHTLYMIFYQTLNTFVLDDLDSKNKWEQTVELLDKDITGALALYSRLHFNVYGSLPDIKNKEGLGCEGFNFSTFSGLGYTRVKNKMLQKSIYSVNCKEAFLICYSIQLIGNMALLDKTGLDKAYESFGKQSFIEGLFADKHVAALMSIEHDKNTLGYYDKACKYLHLAANYLNPEDSHHKLITCVLFRDALLKLDNTVIGEPRYTTFATEVFKLSERFKWHLIEKEADRIMILKDLAPDDVESIIKSSNTIASETDILELPAL